MTIAEHELEFHRRAIEQARGAGLSAYVLNENGSVLRIWPDGTKQFIVVRHGLWSESDPRDASRPTLNSEMRMVPIDVREITRRPAENGACERACAVRFDLPLSTP